MKTFIYRPFNSIIEYCPVVISKGKLFFEQLEGVEEDPSNQGLTIVASTCNDGWGYIKNFDIKTVEAWPMPNRLLLRFLSKADGLCYEVDTPLDAKRAEELWLAQEKGYPQDSFKSYIVGTTPYGGVAIWLQGATRSILFQWIHANEVELNEIELPRYGWIRETESMPFFSRKELEDNMQQFYYRYVALEEHWDWERMAWVEYEDNDPYYDDLDLDSVEDHRSDGTFNYIRGDESQLKYHTAGKPHRITVRWHAGNTEYLAHFWILGFMIRKFFNTFFHEQVHDKADFLLRLDPENNAYQLALRADQQSKPYIIPFFSYQLIVFKDGIEHYVSKNYQLEDGQWSWLWREKEETPEAEQKDNKQQ
jgi:hypothetical protein